VTYIAPIVEGHGEVEALPALLHRIANAEGFRGQLIVNAPIRVKAGSFLNDPEYRRKQIILAAGKAAEHNGSVLILLDCDDDCPAELGPRLLAMFVALAYKEYESWFLAAARSLRGHRGLPEDLEPPPEPEMVRDAKGWLGKRMETFYDPITHQVEFSRAINLDEARTCSSFGRLYDRVAKLLAAANPATGNS
jgi:hypothetical protein